MKPPLRYLLNKFLFWRRCWWCKHSGFGPWPASGQSEARCNLISHDDYELTVAPNHFCTRWEGMGDDDE